MVKALAPRLYTVVAARYVRVRGASKTILGIVGSDYVAGERRTRNIRSRGTTVSRASTTTPGSASRDEPNSKSNSITVSVIWQPLSRYNPIPDYTKLQLDRAK